MNCWQCGGVLPELVFGKVSFRATCEACLADLHCCKNCRFYEPGRPNDCKIPGTDYVADRTKNNLCEDFSILGKKTVDGSLDAKKKFDDLFK